MKNYDKILFVSNGNTATSPMAEAILQNRFRLEDILIESRGLVVLFPEPVNPKAEAVLVRNGLTMKDHTSRQLTEDDFDPRTLVLAMDSKVKEKMLSSFEKAQNVFTLGEYVGTAEDVTDPYGGSLGDYGHCYEQLSGLIALLENKLTEEER